MLFCGKMSICFVFVLGVYVGCTRCVNGDSFVVMLFDCGKLVKVDKYLLVELLDDYRPSPFASAADFGCLELL
jgi:hypothetical protein